MSRKLLFWTLPFILLLFSWSDVNVGSNANAIDETTVAKELISLVNGHRLQIGKPVLIRNATADKLAAEHTSYMIAKNGISHDNYDKRWETLEQKENAQEVTENIGYDINAEKAIEECLKNIWLKANVEGDFTHTGIAVRKDKSGKYYYTQLFFK
ncbi:MAG: CAP domain-containing protein [Flavobacteriaceae bacterium]|nr:CAP domain-containing protein [Flavobacteriaceae bacterium]